MAVDATDVTKVLKIISKTNENKKCFNCDALGSSYVVPQFGVFVCQSCSGIHMKFSHRVKSIMMSTFSFAEVKELELNGNKAVAASYLYKWKNGMPNCVSRNKTNVEKWIQTVLINKTYYDAAGLRELRAKEAEALNPSPEASPSSCSAPSPSPKTDSPSHGRDNGKVTNGFSDPPDELLSFTAAPASASPPPCLLPRNAVQVVPSGSIPGMPYDIPGMASFISHPAVQPPSSAGSSYLLNTDPPAPPSEADLFGESAPIFGALANNPLIPPLISPLTSISPFASTTASTFASTSHSTSPSTSSAAATAAATPSSFATFSDDADWSVFDSGPVPRSDLDPPPIPSAATAAMTNSKASAASSKSLAQSWPRPPRHFSSPSFSFTEDSIGGDWSSATANGDGQNARDYALTNGSVTPDIGNQARLEYQKNGNSSSSSSSSSSNSSSSNSSSSSSNRTNITTNDGQSAVEEGKEAGRGYVNDPGSRGKNNSDSSSSLTNRFSTAKLETAASPTATETFSFATALASPKAGAEAGAGTGAITTPSSPVFQTPSLPSSPSASSPIPPSPPLLSPSPFPSSSFSASSFVSSFPSALSSSPSLPPPLSPSPFPVSSSPPPSPPALAQDVFRALILSESTLGPSAVTGGGHGKGSKGLGLTVCASPGPLPLLAIASTSNANTIINNTTGALVMSPTRTAATPSASLSPKAISAAANPDPGFAWEENVNWAAR